jgi:hypothetical protein
MQLKLLVGIFSACLLSNILIISSSAFAADKSADASNKLINVKILASRQSRLSDDLTTLESKLAGKASSSSDKNVIDQANLVHKAAGEAKQAADDLAQAATLTTPNGKKKSTDSSNNQTGK